MSDEDDLLADIAATLQRPVTIGAPKRGRPPKLTRSQVDDILLSDDLVDNLAMRYGVSTATIIRARRHEYVTATEPGHHTYFRSSRGRRTLSGTKVDDDLRARIAADPSPAALVASTYGISRSYVYLIRAEFGMSDGRRRSPLPHEVMEEIRQSDLPDDQLASLFDLSLSVVRAVRGPRDDQTDT